MTTTEEKKQPLLCPFTVLIDTAEQAPYSFEGLKADANLDYRPLVVQTEFRCLLRHPESLGDYSFEGIDKGEVISGFGRCHVERKSKTDCQSTVLGFEGGRRERFEKELENLSAIESGLVIVECSEDELLTDLTAYGSRSPQQIAKTLYRSILAYRQDYAVQWVFARDRRWAEKATYLWLNRFWEKAVSQRRRERREAKKQNSLDAKLAAL